MRTAKIERNTKETSIKVELNLDGTGQFKVNTGIGFLNHMIEQLSHHSLIDISLEVKGDLHIDFHHTTEDAALAIESESDKICILLTFLHLKNSTVSALYTVRFDFLFIRLEFLDSL